MPLITNSALAAQIQGILDQFETVQNEFQDWISGEVGGGDALDGRYPLTDRFGTTRLTLSPAQLEDDVTGPVASATAAQAAAELAETNAAASAAAALAERTLAETARTGSETAQSLAEAAAAAALSYKAIALAQAGAASASAAAALVSETNAAAAEAGAVAAAGLVADPGFDAIMTWNDTTNVAEWVSSITESQITDGTILARLAAAETVTGAWSFSALISATLGLTVTGATSAFKTVGSQINIYDTDGTDPLDRWVFDYNSGFLNFYWYDDSLATWHLPLRLDGANDRVGLMAGTRLRVYDAANTDYVSVYDSGTQATFASNTNAMAFLPQGATLPAFTVSTTIVSTIGAALRVYDAGITDYLSVAHDGVDVNFTHQTTANWNITGITAINAGTVDADFDAITATSYGGITEANLLDKSATETVSGTWTFSSDPKISGTRLYMQGFTANGGADFVLGAQPGTTGKRVAFYDYQNVRDGLIWDLDANSWTMSGELTVGSGISTIGGLDDIGQVGPFAFMDWNSTYARFGGYNWDTGAWQPTYLLGSALTLQTYSTSPIVLNPNATTVAAFYSTVIELSKDIRVYGGSYFRIYDATTTDYMAAAHDGTNLNFTFVNTDLFHVNGVRMAITGANSSAIPAGINGQYSTVGGATTFGATIWALDTAYDGGYAGADSANTSVYGIRWLRSTHASAPKVGEGLYGFLNGTNYWGIGQNGLYLSGDAIIGGNIYSPDATGGLTVAGGSTSGNGANIELYGGSHATLANDIYIDADEHTWRSQNAGTAPMYLNAVSSYLQITGDLRIKKTGSHLLLFDTDDAVDTADYSLIERNGLAMNFYFRDNSAATWYLGMKIADAGAVTQYYAGTAVVATNAEGLKKSSEGQFLHHASTSYSAGSVTLQSGGSPSGGSNGDIILIY